ncbi:MAG TPA: glycosyltransferase [Bacteroidia bacterium]|jgi:spore maturation protein CgeB|nr:glycosyltransferase [Bacteroidia bacterium]
MEKTKLRFLFLIEDYNLYYSRYYERNPGLAEKSYSEQLAHLLDLHYYQGDSYSSAIAKLGHEAQVVIIECNPLQLAWLREHDYPLYLRWKAGRFSRSYQARIKKKIHTYFAIRQLTLKSQIEQLKPDVIFVYSGVDVSKDLLGYCKSKGIKLILHWSCLFLDTIPYSSYDLIITSARQLEQQFTGMGLHCVEFQQAFDERVLDKLGPVPAKDIDVSFIGNLLPGYSSIRTNILEHLARNIRIQIWGGGFEILEQDSPIHEKHKGRTGGLEMYNIYRRSKIALHIRNDGYSDFAGAKRYFEVTGAGTLLFAYYQANIVEYFKPGEEIITFVSAEDCLEKIRYFLTHEEERKRIAFAGQARILREHTFHQRAKQLLQEIEKL